MDNSLFDLSPTEINQKNSVCKKDFSYFNGNPKVLQLSYSPKHYFFESSSDFSHNFLKNFQNNILYEYTGSNDKYSTHFFSNESIKNNYTTTQNTNYFARYLIFKALTENGNIVNTGKLIKLESHVLIKK
ncbi:MAG: hypothetical protein GXP45_00135 [bacterium]|nr:hypothetical protein [bacterium]